MRIKKWEKWYWGIVLTTILGLLTWVILREKGFTFKKESGEEKKITKLSSALIIIFQIIPLAWFWFVLRNWLLKPNDFICKHCKKVFGLGFETEKEVCKACYERRNH